MYSGWMYPGSDPGLVFALCRQLATDQTLELPFVLSTVQKEESTDGDVWEVWEERYAMERFYEILEQELSAVH